MSRRLDVSREAHHRYSREDHAQLVSPLVAAAGMGYAQIHVDLKATVVAARASSLAGRWWDGTAGLSLPDEATYTAAFEAVDPAITTVGDTRRWETVDVAVCSPRVI